MHSVTKSVRSIYLHKIFSLDTLGWLRLRPVIQNRLQQQLKSQIHSDAESTVRILTQSTLIVQDGVDIEELPILIKRATSKSLPFLSHTYSGEKVLEESEFDTNFRQDLRNCHSVNDVFRLLEVPSEKVRGLSASLALQRLHVLKYLNTDWNQIHSFIRTAVMRELYDIVQRDVGLLSNNTLISLVECYLAADGFSLQCIDAINAEIQSRLGDGVFSIEELLNLAHILKSSGDLRMKPVTPFMGLKSSPFGIVSENASRFLSNDDADKEPKIEQFDKFSSKCSSEVREEIRLKCSELLNNIWIHLTSRYQDVSADTLPLILRAVTSDNRSIIHLLNKPLEKCWMHLSPEGVGMCLDSLNRLRANNTAMMAYLGRWAYVNIHQVTAQLLLSFLSTFIHFGYLDENLMKVMERCLSLKGPLVQTDVIAMCVEYCRSNYYLSPMVMDAAANHFTQYAYSYEPLQLFVVLRAFGQLNYLPAQSSAFLKKVESCLWDRFNHLPEVHLLEILGSFTFIDILPKNFYNRTCSFEFTDRISKLTGPARRTAASWQKLLKHALVFSDSEDMEKTLRWVLHDSRNFHHLYHDCHKAANLAARSILSRLLGVQYYHVLPFYGCCAMYLNSEGVPLKVKRSNTGSVEIQGEIAKKLVIILRSSDHFIVNTKQLIGVQAQRLKHLKGLGFVPIEVRTSYLMYEVKSSPFGGFDLLKSNLLRHINFRKFKSAMMKQTDDKEADACNDAEKFWLSSPESNKNEISVEDSGLLTNDSAGGVKDKDEPE